MYRMIAVSLLMIIASSKAEDFLKCSAVGKSNEKCVKDFYPDQEAQESNFLNAYEDNYEGIPEGQPPPFHSEHTPPSIQYSEQNQYIQGPVYDYGYTVNDEITGDQKFHRETRRDNVVHGTYSLIEPDGSKRTVVYTADDVHGFKAVVYRDEANSGHNYGGNTQPIPISSSDETNTLVENIGYSTNGHNYGPADQTLSNNLVNENGPFYGYQNNAPNPQETTQVQPSIYHPSPFQTVFDQNSNQNIPLVDSTLPRPQTSSYNPEQLNSELELLNHLGGVLGEQNFVNSLVKEVHHLPSPSTRPADVANDGDNGINVFTQIAGATVNPLRMQLLTELVKHQNAEFLESTGNSQKGNEVVAIVPNPVEGLIEVNSTVVSSIGSKDSFEDKIVPHNAEHTPIADLSPSPYPPFQLNTHSSTPSAESYDSKSSTVVERPHDAGVTTPVPITNNIFPARLNNLNFGEFPLLAHISPSYSRRYARHYA